MELKVKEGITHILMGVSTYGELDGPDAVIMHIDTLEEIGRAHAELIRMREAGIEVAKISLYGCFTWIDAMPPVTPEFAEKVLVFGDVMLDALDLGGVCEPANNEGELDDVTPFTAVEIERLNVFNDLFSITASLKHTDVEMGTNVYYSNLQELPTLAEELAKLEETV